MNIRPDQLEQIVSEKKVTCASLTGMWSSMIPAFCPTQDQFSLWLYSHELKTVLYAIRETAKKQKRSKEPMTPDHLIRYCSKVMNNKENCVKTPE